MEPSNQPLTMNFNTAIQPFVAASKVFGLAPFTFVSPHVGYQKSLCGLIYSILIFIGTLTGLYIYVPHMFLERPRILPPVMETTSYLAATCGILIYIYSHCVSLFNRDKMHKLISDIDKAGKVLEIPSAQYGKFKNFLIAELSVFLVFGVISAILLMLAWDLPLSMKVVVTFGLIGLAEISSMIAELQFDNLMLMVNQLYKALCSRLLGSTGVVVKDPPTLPVIACEVSFVEASTGGGVDDETTPKDANHLSRETSADVDDSGDVLDATIELHCTLFDTTRTVSSLFGFQNVAFIISDFCVILYALFFVCDYHLDLRPGQEKSLFWLVYLVFEGTVKAMRLVLMVVSCTLVTDQVDELGYIVSKLQTTAKDTRIRNQMQVFSNQLLHRRVCLTACGLLPLDASLISTIVGGVTTYLVIVIQFQTMSLPSPSPSPSPG